jgi:DNA-binding FrmR family transcriptional regulator
MELPMPLDDKTQKDVSIRLKRANGHLNSVVNMVENGDYCIDVMNQLKAVQSALDKASQIILRNHLNTCVYTAIKEDNAEKVIDELIEIYKRSPICFYDKENADRETFPCCSKD